MITEETAARIIRTAQLATAQPINRRRDVTTSEIPTLRDQETPRRSRTPPPVSQVHPPAANQILYIDSGGVGNSHTSPQLKENTRREGMTEPQKRKRGRPAKLKSLVKITCKDGSLTKSISKPESSETTTRKYKQSPIYDGP
ncbi:Uncharacterized protein Rs2_33033 [Raphanus sativus]|nr:Uncharacterized protein Rs2_33033 [Raphanus sativus]